MKRPEKSIKRAVAIRPQLKTIVIYGEGKKTEPSYFKAWQKHFRGHVKVEFPGQPARPQQLVNDAVGERTRRLRNRSLDANDELWCVFDVDDHSGLAIAVREAQKHGIRVAVSNPCIELWFLLHWADQTSNIRTIDVQRKVRKQIGDGKTLPESVANELITRFPLARSRAQTLHATHVRNGIDPSENPSTNVWELVEAMGYGAAAVAVE